MHICFLHSYKCNTIWNAFHRDAIWLGSQKTKYVLLHDSVQNKTCYNYFLNSARSEHHSYRSGGDWVVAIRDWAEAQKLPNIIRQSSTQSNFNVFTHTSELKLKKKKHRLHRDHKHWWTDLFILAILFKRLTFSACRPLYPVSAHNDVSDVCTRKRWHAVPFSQTLPISCR